MVLTRFFGSHVGSLHNIKRCGGEYGQWHVAEWVSGCVTHLVESAQIELEIQPPTLYQRKHFLERPQVQSLVLRWQFVVGREDRCWHKVRVWILRSIGLCLINQTLKLLRCQFRDSCHLQTHVLKAFFVRAVYQYDSNHIVWVFRLIEPDQHPTKRMPDQHVRTTNASICQQQMEIICCLIKGVELRSWITPCVSCAIISADSCQPSNFWLH